MQDAEILDNLALERTRLANERTLLAYVRTSLALAAAGAALLQFYADAPATLASAWAFIILAAIAATVGVVRFRTMRRRIEGIDRLT